LVFLLLLSIGPLTSAALPYSTFLSAGFQPAAIATDSAGNIYLAGSAPSATNSLQTTAVVVKLNPKGTAYVYQRVLGGSGSDSASAIAVDSAGNAYITGSAGSPDFPVSPGGQLATPPAGPATSTSGGVPDTRTFLVKLNPQGDVLLSEFLGGSVANLGQAVALAPNGNILVSGTASPGFPVTSGAYNGSASSIRPYLLALDPTGATVKFSSFGIGGSSLATDAAGNIYMSGATVLLDYPTTPGAYQTFQPVFICYGLCQLGFVATNQYFTKVDPTGSKLLYSTALGGAGQTTNSGLAVDAGGNVYLTGLTYASYPYTVPDPGTPQIRPFLTKIDPTGQKMLYSIPIGGAGVALDAGGNPYVGGSYNNATTYSIVPGSLAPPGLPLGATAPPICQVNNITTVSQAYVSRIDAASGNVVTTMLVDSSNLSAIGIAVGVAAQTVWLTGTSTVDDVPITPGAVTLPTITPATPGPLLGAYLGMADFSATPAAGTPQLSCLLDAGNASRLGPVAPNQILSLFGTNLGPAQGVAASNDTTISLGGVTVTFNGTPGALLYVSSTQINVAVPFNPPVNDSFALAMQINSANSSSAVRQLPLAAAVPGIFATLSAIDAGCTGAAPVSPDVYVPFLLQNGAPNSCSNPATAGTVLSMFLNGLGGQIPESQTAVVPMVNGWPAEVVGVVANNSFVWRVDFKIPAEAIGTENEVVGLQVFVGQFQPVTPLGVGSRDTPPGSTYPMYIWLTP
jgi:uncharacterized protein (TIGR03437 family)